MRSLPNNLHSLPLNEVKHFFKYNFPLIGTGTGRRAYDLGNGTIAKVAINAWGRQQIYTENDSWFSDPGHDAVFNVPVTDPRTCGYNYAIYQKASTLSFHKKFKAFAGITWKAFQERTFYQCYHRNIETAQKEVASVLMSFSQENEYDQFFNGKPNKAYIDNQWALENLTEEFGEWCGAFGDTLASGVTLGLGDFRTKTSFGFVQGKLKVIDFGCDYAQYTKWIKNKRNFKFDD
jgi:hypothetical protein